MKNILLMVVLVVMQNSIAADSVTTVQKPASPVEIKVSATTLDAIKAVEGKLTDAQLQRILKTVRPNTTPACGTTTGGPSTDLSISCNGVANGGAAICCMEDGDCWTCNRWACEDGVPYHTDV